LWLVPPALRFYRLDPPYSKKSCENCRSKIFLPGLSRHARTHKRTGTRDRNGWIHLACEPKPLADGRSRLAIRRGTFIVFATIVAQPNLAIRR
jgi:hypothetical protein